MCVVLLLSCLSTLKAVCYTFMLTEYCNAFPSNHQLAFEVGCVIKSYYHIFYHTFCIWLNGKLNIKICLPLRDKRHLLYRLKNVPLSRNATQRINKACGGPHFFSSKFLVWFSFLHFSTIMSIKEVVIKVDIKMYWCAQLQFNNFRYPIKSSWSFDMILSNVTCFPAFPVERYQYLVDGYFWSTGIVR